MVPGRVSKGNLVTERLESLGVFLLGSNLLLCSLDGLGCRGRGHRSSIGLRLRLGGRGFGVKGSDQKLLLVLLENTLVVVLPELLGSVLAADALENLLTSCYASDVSFEDRVVVDLPGWSSWNFVTS